MTLQARYALQLGNFKLDVNFTVPATGLTALFGSSGSGKSTCLRCIAGLEKPASGFLQLADRVWQDSQQGIFQPPHRRPFGYVFQDAALFPHLSVKDNLLYGFKRIPADQRRLAVDEVVELLGLPALLTRRIQRLSGGEKQRVAIGRALLTSPSLLLMDEPLSALDSQSKAEIMPYLEQLHQTLAIPVLYISHALDEVARLADQVVVLEDGKVSAQGTVNELLTRLDFGLSHQNQASAILETVVKGHDEEYGLMELKFGEQLLILPDTRSVRGDYPVGQKVRVIIHARDVSVTLQRPEATSILNIFPAEVLELQEEYPSRVLLKLMLEDHPLLCRITRKSAHKLELTPGKHVFAQVKSAALI